MADIENIIPNVTITANIDDYNDYLHGQKRRIYLQGRIVPVEDCDDVVDKYSMTDEIIALIIKFNREDKDIPREDRKPIILYINSPGGDLDQGLALIDTIELSKTPIYTVAYGVCASAAFMIFITGDKRFTFPRTTFLMHDGNMLIGGSTFQVHDQADFSKRVEREVVRKHILAHGKMKAKEYDKRLREEHFMLPADAMKYGFADEIVDDIDKVL